MSTWSIQWAGWKGTILHDRNGLLLEIGKGEWVAKPWKKHSLTIWSYSQDSQHHSVVQSIAFITKHCPWRSWRDCIPLPTSFWAAWPQITASVQWCTGCVSVAKCVLILIKMVYQFLSVASTLTSVHILLSRASVAAVSHTLSHVAELNSPHWCWCKWSPAALDAPWYVYNFPRGSRHKAGKWN